MKRLIAMLAASAVLALIPGVVSAADEVFSGTLRGDKEVPAVSTSGAGTAYVFINEAQTEVKYAVSYTGLTGPVIAAHIHVGNAGTNGPIMLPLQVGPSTMFGTLTQADFQTTGAAPTWAAALNAIRAGRAYVNLHTTANPAGEIRAQLAGTATPTPSVTAAPTTAPTAAPATPVATVAVSPVDTSTGGAGHTPPPTSTIPASGRQSFADLTSVLIVLLIAVVAGGFAAWKLQTPKRRVDDWD